MAGRPTVHDLYLKMSQGVTAIVQAFQKLMNNYLHYADHTLRGTFSPAAWVSSADVDGRRALLTALIHEVAKPLGVYFDNLSAIASTDITSIRPKIDPAFDDSHSAAELVKHFVALMSAVHIISEFDRFITMKLHKEGNVFKSAAEAFHETVQDEIKTIGDTCQGWSLALLAYKDQMKSFAKEKIATAAKSAVFGSLNAHTDPAEAMAALDVKHFFETKVRNTFSVKSLPSKFMSDKVLNFTKGPISEREATFNPFYTVATREAKEQLELGKDDYVAQRKAGGCSHQSVHKQWSSLVAKAVLDGVNKRVQDAPLSHEVK